MHSKFRKVLHRTAAVAVAAICLISSTAYAAGADEKTPTRSGYSIVAVGDSVTAGYEYGFTEQSVPYGFVEHVYEQALFRGLRAEYTNYGVLGLRTNGLKRLLEAVQNQVAVTGPDIQSSLPDPRAEQIFAKTGQLRSALTKADLVVMTIGGNDMYAVLAKLDGGGTQEEAAEVLEQTLDSYEKDFEAALGTLLELQPNARIVVADQYLPIPPPIKVGALTIPLYPETNRLFLIESLKQLRQRLDEITARFTKEGFNIGIANVARSFTGNELSYTSIADGDIHPSSAGYAAMGKAFTRTIWGEYRTVSPRGNGVPVSVVVKGKELISANKPLLVQNRTYVPLRDIVNALGVTTNWNAATRTAAIEVQGRTVHITVGVSSIRVNGVSAAMNGEPAFLHPSGKTSTLYVPLAALSEGLQFQVVYRSTIKTVFIN
ncbi:stalk domain-containing protein [Paenibacillus sp. sgz302251]|uniref:stalk domain-containing protein n=1 Tax=Paenibacillus sp. sgz302251 TaxID=3414493 RepID=UPI003C79953C